MLRSQLYSQTKASTSQKHIKQAQQRARSNEEITDEDECGDTDEHIIHSAASFNPAAMVSASDSSGATTSQRSFNPAEMPSIKQ